MTIYLTREDWKKYHDDVIDRAKLAIPKKNFFNSNDLKPFYEKYIKEVFGGEEVDVIYNKPKEKSKEKESTSDYFKNKFKKTPKLSISFKKKKPTEEKEEK